MTDKHSHYTNGIRSEHALDDDWNPNDIRTFIERAAQFAAEMDAAELGGYQAAEFVHMTKVAKEYNDREPQIDWKLVDRAYETITDL